MIAVCAWCQRDGLPGVLGEREPLEDPGLTHGMCEAHEAKWRAEADLAHAQRQAARATAA